MANVGQSLNLEWAITHKPPANVKGRSIVFNINTGDFVIVGQAGPNSQQGQYDSFVLRIGQQGQFKGSLLIGGAQD